MSAAGVIARYEVVDHGTCLHLRYQLTGRTACGFRVDDRDRYPTPEGGWRQWADRPRDRCRTCERKVP